MSRYSNEQDDRMIREIVDEIDFLIENLPDDIQGAALALMVAHCIKRSERARGKRADRLNAHVKTVASLLEGNKMPINFYVQLDYITGRYRDRQPVIEARD